MISPSRSFALVLYRVRRTGAAKGKEKNLLKICPVETSRTEKGSGTLVIKAAVDLGVARNRWIEGLAPGGDPVQNGTLQSFGVVGSSTRRPFLNLDRRLREE